MNQAMQEPWFSDVGYGLTEAGHMWAESENVHAPAHYLDANFGEAFKIDDVSSVFHYEPITRLDRRSCHTTEEHNDECRVFKGLLCEDEIANLPLAVYLPTFSEDNIVDFDFPKQVPELDFKFCDDLSFGNSRSALNSPETSKDVVVVSESSIPLPKGPGSTDFEMLDVAGSKCRDDILIEDGMCLTSSEDRSINCPIIFAEDSMNCLPTNSLSGGKMMRSRQKRLCRPPNKYSEGSPMSKPRCGRPRKCPMSSSKEKDLRVMSQKTGHVYSSKIKALKVSQRNLELDSDDEYAPTTCLNSKKDHNRNWTLDEVITLLDGITHFGQGRWTAIQKTFFTSSLRTPTDIRDKWRNLVKTYCANLRKKRKEQHLKKGSLTLPVLVIERVRELAQAIAKRKSELETELSDSRC